MDFRAWLLLASLAVSGFVSIKTIVLLQRYRYRATTGPSSTAALPTVSVCIPARNEMHALAECLERVLASDYEKLEVLVLDDSSNDDTPHIIHSFAHAGVRFVPGKPLPNGWLGKNHALATLAEEASGEYVVFMDVDAHIASNTVALLTQQLLQNNLTMISVLPRRNDTVHASALFGTARQMWELVFARKANPPSSSVVWMIRRSSLLELDKGLEDYGMSVRPEHHIAKALYRRNAYRYIVGSKSLGVAYEKRLHSQYETAERLYYAFTGKNIFWLVCCVLSATLLIVPWFYVLSLPLLAVVVLLVQWVGYGAFTLYCYGGAAKLVRIVAWPYVLLQDIVLLLASFGRYSTSTVVWKGRRVTMAARVSSIKIDE